MKEYYVRIKINVSYPAIIWCAYFIKKSTSKEIIYRKNVIAFFQFCVIKYQWLFYSSYILITHFIVNKIANSLKSPRMKKLAESYFTFEGLDYYSLIDVYFSKRQVNN